MKIFNKWNIDKYSMSRSKLNSKLSLRSIFPLFLERLKPNTKSQCLYFIANLHRLKYIRNICIYIFQLYISFPKIVMNLIKQHHYSIQFKFPRKSKESDSWIFLKRKMPFIIGSLNFIYELTIMRVILYTRYIHRTWCTRGVFRETKWNERK